MFQLNNTFVTFWIISFSELICGGFQMTNVTTNITIYFKWEIIDKPLPGSKYPQIARNMTWKTYPLKTRIYHKKWEIFLDTFRQRIEFKGKRNGEWYYFFGNYFD